MNLPQPYWQSDGITLYCGDCREVLPSLGFHNGDRCTAVVSDPPYGLEFMGKDWDAGVPGVHFWQLIAAACLPGAPLLAFGGTRTFHRLVCAIEDAGWEVRDTITYIWCYGSGFPKSLDISKSLDKAAGAEREIVGRRTDRAATPKQDIRGGNLMAGINGGIDCSAITAPATDAAKLWHGYGTALKPAFEPVCLAMNPLDGTFAENALKHGVAGLAIDRCRIAAPEGLTTGGKWTPKHAENANGEWGMKAQGRATPHTQGRWPANILHDGSEEVLAGFPVTNGSRPRIERTGDSTKSKTGGLGIEGGRPVGFETPGYGDTGSAARFFYCSKSSRREREAGCEGMEERQHHSTQRTEVTVCKCGNKSLGNNWPSCPKCGEDMRDGERQIRDGLKARNHHPTVKPLALMTYLVRLVTMPGRNLILDPFMGSGTTGIACAKAGIPFIGIELNPEYCEIAKRRIQHALQNQPKQQELAVA